MPLYIQIRNASLPQLHHQVFVSYLGDFHPLQILLMLGVILFASGIYFLKRVQIFFKEIFQLFYYQENQLKSEKETLLFIVNNLNKIVHQVSIAFYCAISKWSWSIRLYCNLFILRQFFPFLRNFNNITQRIAFVVCNPLFEYLTKYNISNIQQRTVAHQ